MFEATLFMSLLYNITPHYLYFYSPRKSSHSKIVNSQKVVLDQHIGASSIFFIHSIILSIFFCIARGYFASVLISMQKVITRSRLFTAIFLAMNCETRNHSNQCSD